MSNQLNIRFDDNPELLELIRKICKVRGYRINDFLVRILTDAINNEVSEIANNQTIVPIDERIIKLENDMNELRLRVVTLETIQPEAKPSEPTRHNTHELITKLSELLNNESYPLNSGGKLKRRLSAIISELMVS